MADDSSGLAIALEPMLNNGRPINFEAYKNDDAAEILATLPQSAAVAPLKLSPERLARLRAHLDARTLRTHAEPTQPSSGPRL